jgi:Ca2+-binding RTX toxin-like protein
VTAVVVGGGLAVASAGPAYADHSVVELVTTSATAGNGAFGAEPRNAADDGKRVFFETDEPMVPADTDADQDVYERTGGQTTLVSTGPSDATTPSAFARYAGKSADGTHVFVETAQQLVPEDTDTDTDVYERTGGQTVLVSTAPSPASQVFNAQLQAVARDGTQAVFSTRDQMVATDVDAAFDLYLRAGGQTTLLTGGSELRDAQFRGASPDLGRVLFETLEALVPGDTDMARDVYEAAGGALHLVSTSATAGNGAFNVSTADRSSDASAVLFATDEAMVPTDTDGLRDLYLRSNGQTALVSVGTATSSVGGGDLSADGTHVVFTSSESLYPADTDAEDDLYQWAGGQVSLVSTGPQTPGGLSVRNTQSADGSRVVFSSDEPLVPQDTDTGFDVYQRQGGQTSLLTPGTPATAEVTGWSSDATRIFFETDDAALPGDTDGSTDVYESHGGQLTLLSPGSAELPVQTLYVTPNGGHVYYRTAESLSAADTDDQLDGYSASVAVPANTVAPVISGPPTIGTTLSCSTGAWTGNPETFSTTWSRGGTPLAGATAASYVVTSADVDQALRCSVTATNDGGSTTATSAPVIGGLLPGACANARTGTAKADTILGTRAGDLLRGIGGRDVLAGFGGDDCLVGGRGNDRLIGNVGDDVRGGRGSDQVRAAPGDDRVRGGRGDDTINGGSGRDRMFGGAGADVLLGGPGNDRITSVDDVRDVVRCGPGLHDRVVADRLDRVVGCELVVKR